MRSRVIVKCRERFGYYYEKVMEWLHSISYRAFPTRTTKSNLTEEYLIYERYAGEPFVRDFLEERTHKAIINRYGIRINNTTVNKNEETLKKEGKEIIGKVRLLKNKTLIDEATLIIKDKENHLIYWIFNK